MADEYLYKESPAQRSPGSTKKAGRYLLTFLFLATVMYLLTLMADHDLSGGIVFKLFQLVAFFCLGMFSVFFLKKYYSAPSAIPSNSLWRITLVESVLIAIAITAIYFFTGIVHLLLAAASVGAFLLPIAVDEAFRAFKQMPGVAIITWQPPNENAGQRVQYKKNTEIQFRLIKKTGNTGSMPVVINEKVSEYDLLGHAFNQLIAQNNPGPETTIDTQDENGRYYEWSFFSGDPVLGKRWLDPYATLRMNKITPHTLVIVKRIKTTDI